jgi:hypothetical protein
VLAWNGNFSLQVLANSPRVARDSAFALKPRHRQDEGPRPLLEQPGKHSVW